ncbi:MAG TPA: hypothetical protein DD426_06190 [Clostridiaceae bacterium]|nr:hypothetical protein [Clostridiaceae bacterium]
MAIKPKKYLYFFLVFVLILTSLMIISHYSLFGSKRDKPVVSDNTSLKQEDDKTKTEEPKANADTKAPTAPGDITTTIKTENSIALSWEAATDDVGVKLYEIYLDDIKIGETDTTSYIFNDLEAGTTYKFSIIAKDAAGNSSEKAVYSETTYASIQTQVSESATYTNNNNISTNANNKSNNRPGGDSNNQPPVDNPNSSTVDNNAPTKPKNLHVTGKTGYSVTLSWEASEDDKGVTAYEIYQGTVKIIQTDKTTYKIEGLKDYTKYIFTVKALDKAGNVSAASNAVTVKTEDITAPTKPNNLAARNITRNSTSLTWEASTDNAGVTGYVIYQDDIAVGETLDTSFKITGLNSGTEYKFSVKAKDAAGNFSAAGTTDVRTIASPKIEVSPIAEDGRTIEKSPTITAIVDSSYQVKNVVFLAKALEAPDKDYYPYAAKTKAPYSWSWPTGDPWVPDNEYILKMVITYANDEVEEVTRVVLAHNNKKSIPAAPAELRFTKRDAASVSLAWNASVDKDVVEYYIYQDGRQIGTTKDTSYKVEGLTEEKVYMFRVKSKDMDGNISVHDNTIGVKLSRDPSSLKDFPTISTIRGEGKIGVAGNEGTYSGVVKLSADANSEAGIDRVEFYSKTVAASEAEYYKFPASSVKISGSTYSLNWDTVWAPDGQCIIKVVAYDKSGQVITTTAIFIVDNVEEQPPEKPWKPAKTPPQYMVIAYLAGWGANYNILYDADASRLTHINYAFADIDGQTYTIKLGDKVNDPKNFAKLNQLKEKYPHLKTIISVGGWGWSGNFSAMASTDENRTRFADSVVDFLLQYGFDGVDLDWEYPVSGGGPGTVRNPADKENFPLMLQKIREKLDAQEAKDGKHYSLSIAAGANSSFANNTTIGKSHEYLDYVQLMTYDIHGNWETKADYNAPLYDDNGETYSVDKAVNIFLEAGVPREKLVMGVPFYGYQYTVVSAENNGLRQEFISGGAVSYKSIISEDPENNGYTRYWSKGAQVPYLWNPSTKHFITYDDPESMKIKAEYIKEKGLVGAMIWQLTQDHEIDLLNSIYEVLKTKGH